MELNSTINLARGLVAGWMTDQVNARGNLPLKAGLGVAVVSLVLAIVTSGWWRAPWIILLCLGAAVALVVWLVQKMAKYAISRFATPRSLAGRQAEVQAAIDEMDLPTSPLAIVRFLGRIRKGPGPELDRLETVVSRLTGQLEVPEDL